MPKITMTREALHRLLKPVVLYTGTEDLPATAVLQCVVVDTNGDYVRAYATDRFSAAVARHQVKPGEADADFKAQLHRDTVKQLLTTFKASGADRNTAITLEVDRDIFRVESGQAYALPLDDKPYPSILRIFSQALASTPGTVGQAFTPKLLGRLAQASTALGAQEVKIGLGETVRKPMLATIGDDFLALYMPRWGGGAPSQYEHPELEAWAAELGSSSGMRSAS